MHFLEVDREEDLIASKDVYILSPSLNVGVIESALFLSQFEVKERVHE
jgi:hypothetical protein